MANSPPILAAVALGLALLLAAAGPAAAQNCGCQPNFCCSKFGFCGMGDAYCGEGCRSGPCYSAGSGANVADVVTDAFFNGIKNQAPSSCEGKNFYTRGAFLNAVNSYSGFARGGSEVEGKREIAAFFNGIKNQAPSSCEGKSFYTRSAFLNAIKSHPGFAHGGSQTQGKREIAAFFAHVTHETGSFCYISEINKSIYCDRDPKHKQWPCAAGKKYYGRGPLQLSSNYNYGAAGRDNNFDGLGNPDVVAQDPVIAFKAALWYWMKNVHGVMPQGFGATTRAVPALGGGHRVRRPRAQAGKGPKPSYVYV